MRTVGAIRPAALRNFGFELALERREGSMNGIAHIRARLLNSQRMARQGGENSYFFVAMRVMRAVHQGDVHAHEMRSLSVQLGDVTVNHLTPSRVNLRVLCRYLEIHVDSGCDYVAVMRRTSCPALASCCGVMARRNRVDVDRSTMVIRISDLTANTLLW